jgi:hypothetical protein
MKSHGTSARDAALRRLRRANRWLIAASVTLTGVLTDVAARAVAGKTPQNGATSAAGGSNTATRGHATSSANGGRLQSPQQSPQSAPEGEAGSSQQREAGASERNLATPSEAQPRQESRTQESAPAQEASPPVVSGGS